MHPVATGAASTVHTDWVGNARAYAVAWGLPMGLIAVGLFFGVAARAAIWSLALAWMGTACLLNARRCGRTHCRYTGPYYLLMIVPVLLAGAQLIPLDRIGWTALGIAIVAGGKLMRWLTERAWGRFS